MGQGRESAKQYLAEHPEVMEAIRQEIMSRFRLGVSVPGVGASSPEGAPEMDGGYDGSN
jgi:hypothetical protein